MNAAKKTGVVGVFLFFFGMQSFVSLTQSELFPFSWAGLFTSLVTGERTFLSSVSLVTTDGRELPYARWTTIGTTAAYLARINDEFSDNASLDEPLDENERRLLSRIADELIPPHLDFMNRLPDTPEFVEFKISIGFWERFTGARLHQPDRRRVLYQRSLP